MPVPGTRRLLRAAFAACLLVASAVLAPFPAAGQGGSSGAHPVMIGASRTLDFVSPPGGFVLFTYSERAGVPIEVRAQGATVADFEVPQGHHVRVVETGQSRRPISVEARVSLFATWVPADGFRRVDDRALEMPCTVRREAVLWEAPDSARVIVAAPGVPSGMAVYGDGGVRLFSSAGPTLETGFARPDPSAPLWVLNEPYGGSCAGSYRLTAGEGDGAGSGWPAGLPLWLFGFALVAGFVWWVARLREPSLPRRST